MIAGAPALKECARIPRGTPSSPSWHRKVRAKRSRTRAKVRQGRAISWSAAFRLARHHGTDPAFGKRLMGRSGKTQAQPWHDEPQQTGSWKAPKEAGQGQRGRPWRYWSGSWGSPASKAKAAPRYDQIQLKEESAGPRGVATEMTPASERPVALMQAVQRALTASRKADARMRRLREEKTRRERQWQQWAEEAKASYHQQKKAFESDIQKLEGDMEETAATGRAAADKVTQLVVHGLPSEPTAMEVPMEDASWDALVAEDPEHGESGAGFYQEALAASSLLRPATSSTQAAAPLLQIRPELLQQLLLSAGGRVGSLDGGHPPPPGLTVGTPYTVQGASGDVVLTPDGPGAGTGLLTSDLTTPAYGPLSAHKDRRSSPLHPGQRHHADPKAVRENVKDATKTPPGKLSPGKGLQAKLEAKRAADPLSGAALQPFRMSAVEGVAPLPTGTQTVQEVPPVPVPTPPPSSGPGTQIDLEMDLQDGTRSPGLDGLG